MSTTDNSQSQPSQLYLEHKEPPQHMAHLSQIKLKVALLADQVAAQAILKQLAPYLASQQDTLFQTSLNVLKEVLLKGYFSLASLTDTQLLRKLMNHFTKLARCMGDSAAVQERMLFVLSFIAELIKEEPRFDYPFTRKFLLNLFTIDRELLVDCPRKQQILAILGVIYYNLTRQSRLVKKLKVQKELKAALLTNFSLITELYTLKMFNNAILNLANKDVQFTSAELVKYSILDTIAQFISKHQLDIFLMKMKATLFRGETCSMVAE